MDDRNEYLGRWHTCATDCCCRRSPFGGPTRSHHQPALSLRYFHHPWYCCAISYDRRRMLTSQVSCLVCSLSRFSVCMFRGRIGFSCFDLRSCILAIISLGCRQQHGWWVRAPPVCCLLSCFLLFARKVDSKKTSVADRFTTPYA